MSDLERFVLWFLVGHALVSDLIEIILGSCR